MSPSSPAAPGILARLLSLIVVFTPLAAHATQVIANWDVVPFQRLTQSTKIGVVAFHETGAKVTFRVNGTVVATVDNPTYNDQTDVVEYWFSLNPASYAAGPLTLEATATPDGAGHDSRVLSTLTVYADPSSTLGSRSTVWISNTGSDTTGNGTEATPYATIAKGYATAGDGGTVYLKAGNYTLSSMSAPARSYWATVQAAPGLDADAVRIMTAGPGSTNRYGAHKIRWHKVSLYCQRGVTTYGALMHLNSGQQVWFDGAVMYDAAGSTGNTDMFTGSGYSTWQTNGVVREVTNCNGSFRRNMLHERIGSDVFDGGTLTAINVTVHTIDRGNTSFHPDFIQFYRPGGVMENCILYNVRAYNMQAQGLFGSDGTAEDVAFVNLLLEQPAGSGYRSQLTGTWRHALLWNTTITGQTFDFRASADIQDFDVRNCIFSQFTSDNPAHPSIKINAVHTVNFVSGQTTALGTNATTGNPLYADSANDNYRLTAASPAHGTGVVTPGVPADIDGVAYGPTPNRGAYSSGTPEPGAFAYEPFNYAATTTASSSPDSASDFGWNGINWASSNDIVAPGLSYTGLPTDGNALRVSSNVASVRYLNMAEVPDNLVIGGTPETVGKAGSELWISFLIRADASDAAGTTTAGVQLLGSTTGGSVKLAIGDVTTNGLWSIGRYFNWASSAIAAPTGATTLLVARVQYVSGSNNDRVDLWVNPPLGATPPATANATLTGVDIGSFDRVDVKGNRTSTVDELTFGISWGSVIGQ